MALEKTQRLQGGRRVRGERFARKGRWFHRHGSVSRPGRMYSPSRKHLTFDPRQFELIVIDGGSEDGTVEVLRQWDDKIDYWFSETDSGIYDAMNKGIAAAHGEYVLHLNAGRHPEIHPQRNSGCMPPRSSGRRLVRRHFRPWRNIPSRGPEIGFGWRTPGIIKARFIDVRRGWCMTRGIGCTPTSI